MSTSVVVKQTSTQSQLVSQPAFASQIRGIPQPFANSITSLSGTTIPPGSGGTYGSTLGNTLQRGFMIWDTTGDMPAGYTASNPPTVLFLYNPSTVEASYMISDTTAQTALIYPTSMNPGILAVPLQQSVSFTIYFDRTYELNTAGASSDIQNLGVEVDVRAMKQFTGMFVQSASYTNTVSATGATTAVGSTSGRNSTGTGPGIQQGIMQMILSYVYFSNPNLGICYYGYVSSWDVTYTHFSTLMVPIRAVIDVSMTLLPPPSNNVPSTAAITVGNNQGLLAGGSLGTGTTIAGLPVSGVGI